MKKGNQEWSELQSITLIFFVPIIAFLFVYIVTGREFSSHPDFQTFYTAGMKIRMGNGASLYDVSSYAFQMPFIRPAWQALLFVPFAFCPRHTAYILWSAVSVGLFGLSLWLLRDKIASIVLSKGSLFTKMALVSILIPFAVCLVLGQDSSLFLLLFVLALKAVEEGNEYDAGWWLGIASIKLNLLLPVLLFIVLRKRWQIVSSTLLTGSFLFCLSTSLAGPYWVVNCLRAQATISSVLGHDCTARYLLSVSGLESVTPVILLLVFGMSFWIVRRKELERAMAWIMVFSVFLNWHSFIFDYLAGLPVIATHNCVATCLRVDIATRAAVCHGEHVPDISC